MEFKVGDRVQVKVIPNPYNTVTPDQFTGVIAYDDRDGDSREDRRYLIIADVPVAGTNSCLVTRAEKDLKARNILVLSDHIVWLGPSDLTKIEEPGLMPAVTTKRRHLLEDIN